MGEGNADERYLDFSSNQRTNRHFKQSPSLSNCTGSSPSEPMLGIENNTPGTQKPRRGSAQTPQYSSWPQTDRCECFQYKMHTLVRHRNHGFLKTGESADLGNILLLHANVGAVKFFMLCCTVVQLRGTGLGMIFVVGSKITLAAAAVLQLALWWPELLQASVAVLGVKLPCCASEAVQSVFSHFKCSPVSLILLLFTLAIWSNSDEVNMIREVQNASPYDKISCVALNFGLLLRKGDPVFSYRTITLE